MSYQAQFSLLMRYFLYSNIDWYGIMPPITVMQYLITKKGNSGCVIEKYIKSLFHIIEYIIYLKFINLERLWNNATFYSYAMSHY